MRAVAAHPEEESTTERTRATFTYPVFAALMTIHLLYARELPSTDCTNGLYLYFVAPFDAVWTKAWAVDWVSGLTVTLQG